jgi:hypothetical protein
MYFEKSGVREVAMTLLTTTSTMRYLWDMNLKNKTENRGKGKNAHAATVEIR